MAVRVCRGCPVPGNRATYADQEQVWGVWAGRWHNGKGHSREVHEQRPEAA